MLKCLMLAICLAAGLMAQESAVAPAQPRIAVLPLKGSFRGLMPDQSDSVYQVVTSLLVRLRRFEVMERAQIQAVLGEGKFQGSGLVDEGSAVELGKQLGASFVFLGSWTGHADQQVQRSITNQAGYQENTQFSANISINLRMVDVRTGRIAHTFDATGAPMIPLSVADAVKTALKEAEKRLERVVRNAYPLTCIVLKALSEKELLVDLGVADGAQKGDVFCIIRRGEDIIHPRTGERLPGEKIFLAEVEVLRVDERTSVVKVKKNDQKLTFRPGQELEQKPKEASRWEKFGDFFRK